MNNIHIIHGIQYLQNIKYNTGCSFLNSSFALGFATRKISISVAVLFKSPGILERLCFTYTLKSEI